MIYRPRNKKKNKMWIFGVALLVIFILFRIFNVNITGGFLTKGVHVIQESKFMAFGPIQTVKTYFSSKNSLSEENERLKSENMDLKIELLTAQIISDEFAYFNDRFGALTTTNASVFKVIGRPPFIPFDFIHIAGSGDTYNIDDLVFYQQVVIGKIVEKKDRYATVQLFSNHQTMIPGIINSTQFEVQGLGGGRYLVEVPKDFEVVEGDAVLYPHEKVLVLGLVSSIESTPEDLFKNVYFNIPVNLSEIDFVTTSEPYTLVSEAEFGPESEIESTGEDTLETGDDGDELSEEITNEQIEANN